MSDISEDDAWIEEQYPASEYIVIGEDDDAPERPTVRYGVWLGVVVFFGIVILSFFVVAAIMYVSRSQERKKFDRIRANRAEAAPESLAGSLTSKKWSTHTSRTIVSAGDTFDTVSIYGDDGSADCDVDQLECQMNSSMVTPMSYDKEVESAVEAMHSHTAGSVCAICDREYTEGQEIYESNNARCGHEFHQHCMDKWLAIQNSCPICTQPFVLKPL